MMGDNASKVDGLLFLLMLPYGLLSLPQYVGSYLRSKETAFTYINFFSHPSAPVVPRSATCSLVNRKGFDTAG